MFGRATVPAWPESEFLDCMSSVSCGFLLYIYIYIVSNNVVVYAERSQTLYRKQVHPKCNVQFFFFDAKRSQICVAVVLPRVFAEYPYAHGAILVQVAEVSRECGQRRKNQLDILAANARAFVTKGRLPT